MHRLERRVPSFDSISQLMACEPFSEDSYSVDSNRAEKKNNTKWSEDEKICLAKSVVNRFCKRGSLNSSRDTSIHECWDEIKRDFDFYYREFNNSGPVYERSAKSIRRYYKEMKKGFRSKQTFLQHYLDQWKKRNGETLDKIAQEPPCYIKKNADSGSKKWQYEEDVVLAGAVMLRFLRTGSLANTPDNCWDFIKRVFDENFTYIFGQDAFPRESEEFYKRFKLMREKVQRLQGKSSYFLDLYSKYESWCSYRAMEATYGGKKRVNTKMESPLRKRPKFCKETYEDCLINDIEEGLYCDLSNDLLAFDAGISKDMQKSKDSYLDVSFDINIFWEDDFVLVLSEALSQTF